jgi:hypothetical protein
MTAPKWKRLRSFATLTGLAAQKTTADSWREAAAKLAGLFRCYGVLSIVMNLADATAADAQKSKPPSRRFLAPRQKRLET